MLAQEIISLVRQARGEIKRNPLLAELMLADIAFSAERIYRLMAEAKNGNNDND